MTFDLFAFAFKDVAIKRPKLHVVQDGEEEQDYDREQDDPAHQDYVAEEERKAKKNNFLKQADKNFKGMSMEDKATAVNFQMRYGKNDEEVIEWKILGDFEHIHEDEGDRL